MTAAARTIPLALALALLGAATAATPAAARKIQPSPTVDVQPHAVAMSPDARSVGVQILASCPERWTLVEATVTVSQPGATGTASFPLTCAGFTQVFGVHVTSSTGDFQLTTAHVSATVVASRGKSVRVTDTEVLPVQPLVGVQLAETARLEAGGAAVVMDVTVACPVGTTGVESRLVVSQGQTLGVGLYTPVCDGRPHTFTVRVEASRGTYNGAFVAQALTFAQAEFRGEIVYGIDDDGSVELVS